MNTEEFEKFKDHLEEIGPNARSMAIISVTELENGGGSIKICGYYAKAVDVVVMCEHFIEIRDEAVKSACDKYKEDFKEAN